MGLKLNVLELENVLELFYTMSGVRIVVFDENYEEILAYPEEKCRFCKMVYQDPVLGQKCRKSDTEAFDICRQSGKIHIYKCHAGLTEATIPIKENEKIIGYMMFGQITDLKQRADLEQFVESFNQKFQLTCTPKGIKYRSEKQINAAAQLLEICTNYIQLKEMVTSANHRITQLTKEFVEQNLGTEIKISDICNYAGTNRTKLYDVFQHDCGMGVAEYIRELRLRHAYSLLKTGEYTVSEVSEKIGFSDYNYFSRVFKSRYHVSPYTVRKNAAD